MLFKYWQFVEGRAGTLIRRSIPTLAHCPAPTGWGTILKGYRRASTRMLHSCRTIRPLRQPFPAPARSAPVAALLAGIQRGAVP